MKKNLLVPAFFFVLHIHAQDYCEYEAKEFDKYEEYEEFAFGIASEQGGLFPNAYTIYNKNLQVESSMSLAPQTTRYESQVFTTVSQLRYGIGSRLEMRLGYNYVFPGGIEADTGTHSQLLLGLKAKLFGLDGKNITWHTSITGNYFIENLKSGSDAFPGGYYALINSTLEFYKRVQFDVTFGYMYNIKRNTWLGLLSTQLIVKREESRWGVFTGFGGIYIESYLSAGILYTDNYNFILNMALMTMDNAITFNVCYTHCFKW